MPLQARGADAVPHRARPVDSTPPPITDCNASSLGNRTYIARSPCSQPPAPMQGNLRYLVTNASSQLFGSLHAGSSTAPMRSR